MDRRIGVFVTNGPDPGWSQEERQRRKELHRWNGTLKSQRQMLDSVDEKIANLQRFDVAQRAYLQERRKQILAQIDRAETELAQLELVN